MGNWIFGCDECQSVCPWVKQFRKPGRQRFLKFDPVFSTPLLADLVTLDDDDFKSRFSGTPLLRPKRRGLLRNVCVALGNSGRREMMDALEGSANDHEPLVREHAEWAIRSIADFKPEI
jgi:epoxyqueuosine reductase